MLTKIINWYISLEKRVFLEDVTHKAKELQEDLYRLHAKNPKNNVELIALRQALFVFDSKRYDVYDK